MSYSIELETISSYVLFDMCLGHSTIALFLEMLYSINNRRNHTFATEAAKLQGMHLQILPKTVQVDRYLS